MIYSVNNENFDLEDIKRKLLEQQDQAREQSQKNKSKIYEVDLNKEIPDKNYFENVVNSIKKTVKCEDALIRQILYTGFSSYIEDDPINLGILAPTSEGKTYAVIESLQYFPGKDVINIGKMSTMALVRQKGILINKDTGELIEEKVQELKTKVRELVRKRNATKNKDEKADINENISLLEEEITKQFENSKTLIDLRGKILLFLEPPQRELWEILKPILSHDTKEIEYPVVDKSHKSNNETREIVVRGSPACIFCSAKDESKWEIWAEIKSRILVTSPNMISQKYKESKELISQVKGLPNLIQSQIIISQEEIETTKKCIEKIKEQIQELKSNHGNGNKISLWIPYYDMLEKELPANKGTDVRFVKRIFALLNIIPIVKNELRMVLMMGGEQSIIANLEDLKEVLSICHNLDGLPKFKAEFYDEIFLECLKEKWEMKEKEEGKINNSKLGVTSRELADFYTRVKGRPINTDSVKQTYIDQLINEGLVDYVRDSEDKRQNLYYPLIEEKIPIMSIGVPIDNFSQQNIDLHEKIIKNITEEYVFLQMMRLIGYRFELDHTEENDVFSYVRDSNKFQIWGLTNVITIGDFVKNYANGKSRIDIKSP